MAAPTRVVCPILVDDAGHERLVNLAMGLYKLSVAEIWRGVRKWELLGYSEEAIAGMIRRGNEIPRSLSR